MTLIAALIRKTIQMDAAAKLIVSRQILIDFQLSSINAKKKLKIHILSLRNLARY